MFLGTKLLDKWHKHSIECIYQDMYKRPILEVIDRLIADIIHNDLDFFTVFDKYRMDIKFVKPKSNPKDERLVYNCSFDQLNYVYTFEIRNDIADMGDIEQRLTQELKEAYVHEETHEQQNQGKHRLQPYDDGSDDLNAYLFQFQELPAFARQIAYSLKSKTNLDDKKIIEAIISNSNILSVLPDALKMVLSSFVSVRNSNRKVWQDFLENVFAFLSNLHSTHLGVVEYRKWLKEHSESNEQ